MLASFDRVDGPFFRFQEGLMLARLSAEEKPAWQAARQAALDAGVLFMTGPHHCVVGRKPAGGAPLHRRELDGRDTPGRR
jgi:hypothetical protein